MLNHTKKDKTTGKIVPGFETSYQLIEAQRKAKEAAANMRHFKHLAKIV